MPRFPLLRLALVACLSLCVPSYGAQRLPNVVVVMAEGLGFSDLGCYGGEALTPCLDWIAGRGVRFSQAYHSGQESHTHAALLGGYYAGHLSRQLANEGASPVRPGGGRPAWARMLPEQLKAVGYRSYFAGSWVLGGGPKDAGFDRAYTVEAGSPYGLFPQTLEGEASAAGPSIAGSAVQFLKEHAEKDGGAPYFACVSLPLPSVALQAAAEDVARYQKRFQAGTDELRKERLQRLWGQGMVANAELSAPTPPAKGWSALSRAERDAFETRMEMHAAMVERMDTEIGRVLEQVQASKAWDNTLFIFVSSQSVSAEGVLRAVGDPKESGGGVRSDLCLEAQGASLANAPWRYSHKFLHEGGIAAPLIVHWPGGFKARGEYRDQVVQVVDLAPTILKAAGVNWAKKAGEVNVPPADGVDLLAVLRDNKPLVSRGLWWKAEGNRAFRLGDWKWVSEAGRPAELYYLLADRSELLDLADANHERLLEMEVQWKRMEARFEQDMGRELPAPSLSGGR